MKPLDILDKEQGKKGKVFLVGAGPGDPKLITLRGMEALRKADAAVYDRLANPSLLKYLKPGAERIYAGKLPDKHSMLQDEINQLLVDLALEGKTVVRLKGGDPSVFGRVGEEAEFLAEHGIEFEIIPGVTSAIAVPTYAGIPVTHRDYTSSLAIVSGHECPKKDNSAIDWGKLATATGTLILLMGVSNIESIRDVLIEQGRSADTPVALIRWGTTRDQRTIAGTLETIVDQVRKENFQSPAVIIVGEVVKLREKLSWYEKKPLFGKRILVTRARSQSSELADQIDELGGEAVEFPVIRITEPDNPETLQKLDRALSSLSDFDWVIFTSVNGVDYFFRRLKKLRIDIRTMNHARIAAVGPKTAEALLDRGLVAESLPGKFQADDLLDALLPQLKAGQRVLLPRADIAREFLPKKLRELGLEVTELDVYETRLSAENADEVARMLKDGDIDVITFTSSSTVTNLIEILSCSGLDKPVELLRDVDAVCIGPVTAQTAREAGMRKVRVAEQATIESLVKALTQG